MVAKMTCVSVMNREKMSLILRFETKDLDLIKISTYRQTVFLSDRLSLLGFQTKTLEFERGGRENIKTVFANTQMKSESNFAKLFSIVYNNLFTVS